MDSPTGTESFQDRMRRQQTEAALTAFTERRDTRRAIEDALRLGPKEYLGEVVTLAPGVVVAEVTGGHFGRTWRHVLDGHASFNAWTDRWHAILAAIAAQHDAGDGAELFAGRVLDLPAHADPDTSDGS